MDEAAQNQIFPPLDRTKQQIRLLQLDFSVQDGLIKLASSAHKLGPTCPSFTALSYVWGAADNPRTIEVGGSPFKVRQNLYDFLVYYRSALARSKIASASNEALEQVRTGYIWIDQLCIDQDNLGERNHQVQLMQHIYSQAYGVIIWLGRDEHMSNALQGLRSYATTRPYEARQRLFGSDVNSPWYIFSRNPFWTRLWVIQEVSLARRVVLMCADKAIPWRHLMDTVSARAEHNLRFWDSWAFRPGVERVSFNFWGDSVWRDPAITTPEVMRLMYPEQWNMSKFPHKKSARKEQHRVTLQSALASYSSAHCADPRDKVYGLLGVVDDAGTIIVDYNLDTDAVFWMTAQAVAQLEVEKYSTPDDVRKQSDDIFVSTMLGLEIEMIERYSNHLDMSLDRPDLVVRLVTVWKHARDDRLMDLEPSLIET